MKDLAQNRVGWVFDVKAFRHTKHTSGISRYSPVNFEVVLFTQILEAFCMKLPFGSLHWLFKNPVHMRPTSRAEYCRPRKPYVFTKLF